MKNEGKRSRGRGMEGGKRGTQIVFIDTHRAW